MSRTAVQWLPWHAEAFAQADAEGKPILLWISTAWSEGCHEMARACYADSTIAEVIHDRFVAVRVDADERPDIAERYDLGGIPTTAFLAPDGALLGGGTFVPRDRLLDAMRRVTSVVAEPLPPSKARTTELVPDAEPTPSALAAIVFDAFDPEHGGFGGPPRFPHVAPVRLALRLHAETGDAVMFQRAAHTLDAMGWGGLYDEREGGFYRYCEGADWSRPRREKLLPVNAALLGLYAEAGARAQHDRWLSRAGDILTFMERALRRQDGAWRLAAGVEGGRVYSDATGIAVSALLRAASAFDEGALAARALDALEHVLLSTYRPGEGIAHCGGGVRGLLTDHVSMATALVDACDASGRPPYAMMAEELMRYSLRTMWDDECGGFYDRSAETAADDPCTAAVLLKPFALNCDAVVVLARLAGISGDASLLDRAWATLRAVSTVASTQGPLAAQYLLAWQALTLINSRSST